MIKTLILPVLLLSACGFSPMYGEYSPSSQAEAGNTAAHISLQQIEIDNIPDRDGQILRNELIDRFNYQNGGPSNPRYRLVFRNLAAVVHELDLTKDSESTRAQMKVLGNFDLIDIATGQKVLSRDVSSVSSYNILSSEFATRVTEINARENAIKDVARQVELQISLFLNR